MNHEPLEEIVLAIANCACRVMDFCRLPLGFMEKTSKALLEASQSCGFRPAAESETEMNAVRLRLSAG
jgi:hypothetical protein